MNVVRSGVIINTEKYEACVEFYKTLFGLKELFHQEDGDFRLTALEFGGSYLLIETGGVANPPAKTFEQSSTKLRFNVADIDAALERVQQFGIDAEVRRESWGSTINIHDPDGNRVGIRDEKTYLKQLRE